jgi:hypothetical protein
MLWKLCDIELIPERTQEIIPRRKIKKYGPGLFLWKFFLVKIPDNGCLNQNKALISYQKQS